MVFEAIINIQGGSGTGEGKGDNETADLVKNY
jgi:hypothetical protein